MNHPETNQIEARQGQKFGGSTIMNFELNCPRCKAPLWNPAIDCPNCGYFLPYAFENPSEYQKDEKLPKHGIIYDGTNAIVDPSAWGKAPGSKFVPTTDIVDTLYVIASSGDTVIPQHSGRGLSMVFYFGRLTGAGYLGGQYRDFFAVRLVNVEDSERIHIFPDDIRAGVDKAMICRGCSKPYLVGQIPEVCPCGYPLRRIP